MILRTLTKSDVDADGFPLADPFRNKFPDYDREISDKCDYCDSGKIKRKMVRHTQACEIIAEVGGYGGTGEETGQDADKSYADLYG